MKHEPFRSPRTLYERFALAHSFQSGRARHFGVYMWNLVGLGCTSKHCRPFNALYDYFLNGVLE